MANEPGDTVGGITSRRGFLAGSGAVAAGLASGGVGASKVFAAEAGGGGRAGGAMMKIAEIFSPPADELWALVAQCGATHAVGSWGRAARQMLDEGRKPWSYDAMAWLRDQYNERGFELPVLEWRPPTNKIKMGLPGRDEEIEAVVELLESMGKVGIGVWCYEWMPAINWTRTDKAIRSRGGALVTGFDYEKIRDAPLTEYGEVSEQRLWENLEYFLKRVVPVAERAGVRLAMHPDDPPLSPLRGMGRIMSSIDNYQRLVDLVPSDFNGITMCQGNFTLMTDDLPAVIRDFGNQGKIHFVHFRDVKGTPRKFEETFHDDGKTDMAACMRAYRDIGFDGVCRPDHVPTMEGDSNDRPGYSTIGRLFAIGYIRGLQQAAYSEV